MLKSRAPRNALLEFSATVRALFELASQTQHRVEWDTPIDSFFLRMTRLVSARINPETI
jgi:hypothetical protein